MIEERIPLEAVNYHSAKEKKHPKRFVEFIHQWPARRPRSASRVAIAAALLKAPHDLAERAERLKLLAELAPYECSADVLRRARELIRQDNGGKAPKVLDLFAGGGAIPLEAANLGCEAHAVELNPVAHIIELATCVYPQKFKAELADLVEKWGERILAQARRELEPLYRPIRVKAKDVGQLTFAGLDARSKGEVEVQPLAYLWTRTVPCVDGSCGATVPLVRQTWLCRKPDRAIAMKLVPDREARRVRFELVATSSAERLGFDPADLSDRGDAECPLCGATIDSDKVKEFGRAGKLGQQLMAVAGLVGGERGRVYLPAEAVELPPASTLQKCLAAFGDEWPGPAALTISGDTRDFRTALYGMPRYCDIFSDRQAVALLTFSKTIRESYDRILKDVSGDEELARAVVTYLALALDKLADNNCVLATWEASDQIPKHALTQQALKMIWDFVEINPFSIVAGSFPLMVRGLTNAVRGLSSVPEPALCTRGSATDLEFANEAFDAVITDPPYYNNISYADLSDFFFVWLKRTLEPFYPEHFTSDQTPKRSEATVVPYRHGDDEVAARQHYETLMGRAFIEAGRVLRPGGACVVVYAHKTVAGWSTLVDALKAAGCMVDEAWPLRTESDARLNARNAAALATSIFLVARKRLEQRTCHDYEDEVLRDTDSVVQRRVKELWDAGLQGADLVVATIGAALGPFTRYSEVRRSNGELVSTAEFLEEAQRRALEAVLQRIVRDATGKDVSVGGIDAISRLYVVARMQLGTTDADYDVFKNLAIGALPSGTELDGLKGALTQGRKALLVKKGSKVRLRDFEDRGAEKSLGLHSEEGRPPPLIDVLHRLLWLQKNKSADIPSFLSDSKADLATLRLLAQALGGRPLRAEPKPGAQRDERTAEQRAVDTFLASFQDLSRAARANPGHGPLFDSIGGK
jgi:putative DNA methylase